MVTIVTRAGKGSPLTHNEVDANFTNLNSGKAETASPTLTGTVSLNGTAITATAAELNVLAGIPAGLTATELGYVDGVTSAIQTQLNAKAATASPTLTGTVGIPAATVADGVTTTADNDGTFSSGTYTPTPSGGNMKYISNAGAFTFAAPTAAGDYTLIVLMINATGASTVTFSGFSKTSGAVLTTTVGEEFLFNIVKINGFTYLNAAALQ